MNFVLTTMKDYDDHRLLLEKSLEGAKTISGGQPQMIKVMGGAKIPIQLATSSGSTVNASTIKNFIKTNTGSNDQATTVLQAGKVHNRQLLALPTKQSINLQTIRGPVVVPVSNVQIKQSQLPGRPANSIISSPMVIRTQSGSLAVAPSQGNSSIQNQIHLPQININKQTAATNLLQAQIKQNTLVSTGASIRPSHITLKQQQNAVSKSPDFVVVQQKPTQDVVQQSWQRQGVSSKVNNAKPALATKHQSSQAHAVTSTKTLMNTSILDHSGNRKRHDFDFDYNVENKRRKTEKCGKGLRHFSMKVCEKVQIKGTTSYNEVADELVNEFSETTRSHSPADGVNYDQKNIRRRVYDALNVLMAMNIISKEKKEIRWIGLPTNSLQECHKLEQERRKRIQKIKIKTQQLQDLILQQIAFKNLVERNKTIEKDNGAPPPNSAIQLPFIIVNTNKKTVIDCSISNDKTEYLFNFDDTFEIHDDIEVLKRMGMALGLDKGVCSDADLQRAKTLVPKALENYVTELSEGHTSESILSAKGIDSREMNGVSLDNIESSMSKMYGSDFLFEKAGADAAVDEFGFGGFQRDLKEETLSRHSSLLSLSQDQRTESASPSSFGDDYDGDNFEESDVEIS